MARIKAFPYAGITSSRSDVEHFHADPTALAGTLELPLQLLLLLLLPLPPLLVPLRLILIALAILSEALVTLIIEPVLLV